MTFDPIAVALSVTAVLDRLDILHTIGGSVAASFAGEPRTTIDIDIVAALPESKIPAFVSALTGGRLDREYLTHYAPALAVEDLLDRALRESE